MDSTLVNSFLTLDKVSKVDLCDIGPGIHILAELDLIQHVLNLHTYHT